MFPIVLAAYSTSWSPWGKAQSLTRSDLADPLILMLHQLYASSTLQPFWPDLRHQAQRYCSVVKLTSLHITTCFRLSAIILYLCSVGVGAGGPDGTKQQIRVF